MLNLIGRVALWSAVAISCVAGALFFFAFVLELLDDLFFAAHVVKTIGFWWLWIGLAALLVIGSRRGRKTEHPSRPNDDAAP